MNVAIYTHPIGLAHHTGEGHPERTARLETLHALFNEARFSSWLRPAMTQANEEQILRAHTFQYLEKIRKAIPDSGLVGLDEDTVIGTESYQAALFAAGAVCTAIDDLAAGRITRAFCAMRPPGHHAEPTTQMGFCLFNNVFIGARHAQETHGIQKIAIVDFDVHHGNGTDSMARAHDGSILLISTHQHPCWPMTGIEDDNDDTVMNFTLPPQAGSAAFRSLYETKVFPALHRFQPDLLMLSAGFDGHKDDPLAQWMLETDDYGWLTDHFSHIAAQYCQNRIVSVLEGGYNLTALEESVALHLERLAAPSP